MIFKKIQELTPEQNLLLEASMCVWSLRGHAKKFDSPLGEETITELFLLAIKSWYPKSNVFVLPFNKAEEGKIGADWAWAFQSITGTHVMPMLVQAKILNSRDADYVEIKRTIGKTGIRQIDRLISQAEKLQWPAIYAFYNHLDDPSRIPSTCSTINLLNAMIPEAWGVSVADAYIVRAKLNDQSFNTHSLHSFPLHCLLCSKGSGDRPDDGSGSAGLALNALRRIREVPDNREISSKFPYAEDMAPLPDAPFTELPTMFNDALQIIDIPQSDARDAKIAELSERYPDIAGIVVVRDIEQSEK